jgi:4-amino-4-deoxy-L-arabinose transferase-like glycosyltransferase
MTTSDGARVLRWTVCLVGAVFVLAYMTVALCRMAFPFELDGSEGSIVDHVHRVVSGQQIYVAPSLDFVPTMYTPGYYYAAALVAAVSGDGFVAPRLVSFLASLAVLWLIVAVVRKETGNLGAATLAACLFAATFRATGGWFDLARPDSLFLALLLASLYRLRFATSSRDFAAAGLLLAVSALTKQTALLLGAPLIVYAYVASRRGVVAFTAACAGVLLAVGGVLEWTSAGWFFRYVTGSTGVAHYKIWVDELLWPLPVACLAAAWLAYGGAQTFSDGRRGGLFYALTAVGLIGGSYASNVQRHTAPNALMPPFACLAILFGLWLHGALPRTERGATGRATLVVYALVLLQFAALAYNPWRLVPTSADADAGRRLIEAIRTIDGPVLVYDRGYLARLAGKPGHLSRLSTFALGAQTARDVAARMQKAICEGRYGAVVLTAPEEFAGPLASRYLPAELILAETNVPRTVSFGDPSPNLLYRRRPASDMLEAGPACEH